MLRQDWVLKAHAVMTTSEARLYHSGRNVVLLGTEYSELMQYSKPSQGGNEARVRNFVSLETEYSNPMQYPKSA